MEGIVREERFTGSKLGGSKQVHSFSEFFLGISYCQF